MDPPWTTLILEPILTPPLSILSFVCSKELTTLEAEGLRRIVENLISYIFGFNRSVQIIMAGTVSSFIPSPPIEANARLMSAIQRDFNIEDAVGYDFLTYDPLGIWLSEGRDDIDSTEIMTIGFQKKVKLARLGSKLLGALTEDGISDGLLGEVQRFKDMGGVFIDIPEALLRELAFCWKARVVNSNIIISQVNFGMGTDVWYNLAQSRIDAGRLPVFFFDASASEDRIRLAYMYLRRTEPLSPLTDLIVGPSGFGVPLATLEQAERLNELLTIERLDDIDEPPMLTFPNIAGKLDDTDSTILIIPGQYTLSGKSDEVRVQLPRPVIPREWKRGQASSAWNNNLAKLGKVSAYAPVSG